MSSCCRRNPYAGHGYGIPDRDGVWSEEQIQRSLEGGMISEATAAELRATVGQTAAQRKGGDDKLLKYGAAAAGIAALAYYFGQGKK